MAHQAGLCTPGANAHGTPGRLIYMGANAHGIPGRLMYIGLMHTVH